MKSLADYAQKYDRLQETCPVRAALDVIRGRWKPSVLFELKSGAKRFSDLQSALPGSTAQALSVQLRQLESDGKLRAPVLELAHSFIHMTVNRMIRSAARLHELVLYDLLRRHYDGLLARAKHVKAS